MIVNGVPFMQQLKDVQTYVSYNLDHSKVLLYTINGESSALSDRDMTCNDITDPVTLMDELGKEHPDMKYILVSICIVLHSSGCVLIHYTEGRCVFVSCMCAVNFYKAPPPTKENWFIKSLLHTCTCIIILAPFYYLKS